MAFGIRLHCWGDWACFTRPEMKVERVSYDAMTPSAARGVLEAIYWKPEIRWVIDRVTVLRAIRFTSIRRNEVKEKISAVAASRVMNSGAGTLELIASDGEMRQQRAAMLLRDVSYTIEAHFDIVRGPDNIAKHLDQFHRRARRGACYTRPYLERDLGWMLHDIDFAQGKQARFFRAIMRDGVIDVPPLSKARA
jgi:CRISPR-associated protein Cas5d